MSFFLLSAIRTRDRGWQKLWIKWRNSSRSLDYDYYYFSETFHLCELCNAFPVHFIFTASGPAGSEFLILEGFRIPCCWWNEITNFKCLFTEFDTRQLLAGHLEPTLAHWNPLEASWNPHGANWNPHWPTGTHLRPVGTHMGPIGTHIGPLEPTWGQLKPTWGQLEPTWGQLSICWTLVLHLYNKYQVFIAEQSWNWGQHFACAMSWPALVIAWPSARIWLSSSAELARSDRPSQPIAFCSPASGKADSL